MFTEKNDVPYFPISQDLKNRFGGKIVKLSLDAGFTCPNRDGTKGIGGCSFCSPEGSGELSSDMISQMALLATKWPSVKGYLAYFQSHTNTYAPIERLRTLYLDALSYPNVVGIAIATRPDCLDDDVLDLLEELNRQTFLWVELGLQTIHDETANPMNRGYSLAQYDLAVSNLARRNIRTVTHLILGLPGESTQDMFESVHYVTQLISNQKRIYGIKLHMLNVVKGSTLAQTHPNYIPFAYPQEYINLVCDLLPQIPSEITMHRLTGDVPRSILIAPEWSYKKRTILNGIMQEMKRRGKKQGCDL